MTGPGRPLYVTMPGFDRVAEVEKARHGARIPAASPAGARAGAAVPPSQPRAPPPLGLLLARACAPRPCGRGSRRCARAIGTSSCSVGRCVVELRKGDAREALADRALDRAEIRLLVGGDERERVARLLGARRASDAVDVVVGDVRDVEVDDVRQVLDVDAARRDVRRDEDLGRPVLEPGERLRALRLAAVAVDALAGHAVAHELVREAVRAVLRAREHEGALEVAALEQREQKPT